MTYYISDKDPFDDPYFRFLSQLLERSSPELLGHFQIKIVTTSRKINDLEKKLDDLGEKRIDLIEKIYSNDKALDNYLKQLPQKPGTSKIQIIPELILTIGLSVLLFLGIIQVLGLEVEDISDIQELPKTIIAFAGAICINIAEKISIERHAEHNAEISNRNQLSDEEEENDLNQKKAFWKSMAEGEAPLWLAMIIVISETAFASSGLLSIIPRGEKNMMVVSFLGAGLAAIVNVALAWGIALRKSDWNRDYLDKYQKITEEHVETKQIAVASKAKIKAIDHKINELRKELKKRDKELRKEYRKWENLIKKRIQIKDIDTTEYYKYYDQIKLRYNNRFNVEEDKTEGESILTDNNKNGIL